MKKRTLQIIGDFIIAIACAIPTGYLADRYNYGYKYFYNLFTYESDPQLLIMAKWYTSQCWMILGCGISLTALLMSVYSLFLKANSNKHNLVSIILSLVLFGISLGLNQLLGSNASLQFLISIINPILIGCFMVGFGIASYIDSKKNRT